MADPRPLTYATHRKFVPGFHFVTFGLLVINLVWAIVRLIADFSIDRVFALLLAVALLLLAFYVRTFATQLQDRIIRTEMRLRLARVLPPDLAARVPELSIGQLIALRFAGDEELPELTRRCLDEPLRRREEIKRQIRSWVPDRHRV